MRSFCATNSWMRRKPSLAPAFIFLAIVLAGPGSTFAQFTLINVGHPSFGSNVNPIRPIISGHYVFAANGNYSGITAYNISDPVNPVKVGGTNIGTAGAYAIDLALSGNSAYVAQQPDGLCIYDISNPTNIIGMSHTNIGGVPIAVAVAGAYA